MWCQVAGVTAKDSLDLARLLRGAEFSHERPRNPFDVFDIVDPRTFTRLLIRADLSAMPRLPPPLALLTAQKLVTEPLLLDALRDALTEKASTE